MVINPIIYTLCFMLIDIVTGSLKAHMNKMVKSGKMREGLYHKSAYVCIIVLALLCENAMNVIDIGFALPLVTPCCAYIIATEIVSILENIQEINPELKNNPLFNMFTNVKGMDNGLQKP